MTFNYFSASGWKTNAPSTSGYINDVDPATVRRNLFSENQEELLQLSDNLDESFSETDVPINTDEYQVGKHQEAFLIEDQQNSKLISAQPQTEEILSFNQENTGTTDETLGNTEGKHKSWLSYQSMMENSYPSNNSKVIYLKAWTAFVFFLTKNNRQYQDSVAPSSEDVLNYLFSLKNSSFSPKTIWSVYSRINAVFKRKYGIKLQDYPGITECLKSFSKGFSPKKAKNFSPQEV